MRFVSAKVLGLTAGIALLSLGTAANAQLQVLNAPGNDAFAAGQSATGLPVGTLFAHTGLENFSTTANSQTTSGTVTEDVYQTAGAGSSLDFYYQFTNTSANAITGFTSSVFTGFNTTVGYTTSAIDAANGFVASTYAAGGVDSISRGGNGAILTFDFQSLGTGGIVAGAGNQSVTLIVRTNATTVVASNLSFQGGAGSNAPGFAPLNAVAVAPEPGSLLLVIPGALGVVGMIRRRKSA